MNGLESSSRVDFEGPYQSHVYNHSIRWANILSSLKQYIIIHLSLFWLKILTFGLKFSIAMFITEKNKKKKKKKDWWMLK